MMGDHGSMGDMAGWLGAIGLVWILGAVALLVLIVVATIWLAPRLRHERAGQGGRGSDALEALARRHARVELDRDADLQIRGNRADR